MRKYLLIIFLLPLFAKSQTYFNRQLVLTGIPVSGYNVSTVDGLLWLPPGYDSTKDYPTIISLSGDGQTTFQSVTSLNIKGPAYWISQGWDGSAINPNTGIREEFIIWSPAIHDNPIVGQFNDWFNSAPIKSQLNYIEAHYSVDTNKVFIIGMSAGGYGTLAGVCDDITLIPRFAAAAPLSPVGDGRFPGTLPRTVTYNVPLWFACGAQSSDPQYNNTVQYAAVVPSILQIVSTGGHNAITWGTVCNPANKYLGYSVYEWFLKNSRTTSVSSNTIATNTPSGSPFCVTPNSGAAITVTGSSVGTFVSGNKYTLQMSDASGNFGSPTNLFSYTSTSNSLSATTTIPAGTNGARKFRFISDNPAVVGNASGSVQINLAANSISPTTPQTIAFGNAGALLTGNELSPSSGKQWYDGINPITDATGATYIPSALSLGNHSISLHSTFACATAISNIVSVTVVQNAPSRIYPTKNKGDSGIYLNGCKNFPYNKGDTIVISAANNPYSYITLDCFDSITVINEGGQVILTSAANGAINGGFSFSGSKRVHLTGTGTPGVQYGFHISTPNNRGVGVNVDGRSRDFQIDHLEITNRNAGMWIKEEQSQQNCQDSLAWPNWVLDNFNIHDNYIHNMSAEGLYLGSTDPNALGNTAHPLVFCPPGSGVASPYKPMRLGNFHIWNNKIDTVGRAGIQLSDADSGTSEIDHNTVLHVGRDTDPSQGAGILTGTYTRANIHDNIVNYTKLSGIFSLGSYSNVYNNSVSFSGNSGLGFTSNGAASVMVDTRNSTFPSYGHPNPDSTTFLIKNNTLGSNTDANIRVYRTLPTYTTTGNIICGNNGETKFIAAGVNYGSDCVVQQPDTVCTTTVVPHYTIRSIKTKSRHVKYMDAADSVRHIEVYWFKRPAGKKRIREYFTYGDSILRDSLQYYQDTAYNVTYTDTTICFPRAFGVFYYNPFGTVAQSVVIDTIKNYVGANMMRQNITRGGGAGWNVQQAKDSGLFVYETVNNSSDGAEGYGNYCDSLYSISPPTVTCTLNEPTQNSTNLSLYLQDLQANVVAAHNHGVLVTDGGITRDVVYPMIDYFQTHGQSAFGDSIRAALSLNMASAQAIKAIAQYRDTLFHVYDTMALDYLNFHFYVSNTSDLLLVPVIVNYLKIAVGKNVATNEFGTTTSDCNTLTEATNTLVSLGFPFLCYYAGDTNPAVKNLDCYRDILKNYY